MTLASKEDIVASLVDGEDVVFETSVHWVIFVFPVLLCFFALIVGIFFHWSVGVLILFLSLYPIGLSIITYATTRLVLTNRRVLARYGFFNRDFIQIALNKIESAYLEEPLLGRILGYATVVVKGTGTGNIIMTRMIQGRIFDKELENILMKKEGLS